MSNIAEAFAGQVLQENQVYLEAAKLRHGVPSTRVPVETAGQPAPGPVQQVQPAGSKLGGLLKTAAVVGLSVATGTAIPTLGVKALDMLTRSVSKAAEAEVAPDESTTVPSDLVNWLRQEGLDRAQ